MAENDSVTGLAITIPEEVFTDLNRLEKKIMGLGTITNNIAGNVVASFLKMANGVDPFIKKIGEAESRMGSFRNIDVAGGFASLGKSSTSIEKSTSAIVEMANTMNRTDFSSNIENAHKRLQTLIGDLKIYEEYLNTPNDANQAFAAEGIEQTSKEIKEIIAVIPELEKLQTILSRNDLFQNYIDGLNGASLEARRQKSEMSQLNEYYRELEKTSAQAAKEQEKAAAQAAKAQERQRKEYQRTVAELWKEQDETAKGALESANAARTYNQRAQAMKNLEAAIKNLDKNDKNYNKTLTQLTTAYRNLETQQRSVTNAMGQMQQSQHNLMDISGQLMRRLALVFSVSQVTQYVQKLAQVRGEFELQNAALAAIMQNKDEADRLFSQITQLAVQSPFQLKELVTYTKELAAYRVENEKLFDTTKMLADVSAGLGVDMSRLILGYGQVKAANYLRGCLGYGTPIMLFNGDIKEVQNIVVGDVLINENGEPVNVLELIRGRETMFLVEQVTGHNRISYRVNRNHILTLWNVPDQKLEDVYVYDYLKNKDYYLGCRVINGKKEYYDIEVTKDRIDDYYGFVLDGNKRFRLGDGTITHNTELRQFSEAGINILGELATYFSEIENRAVSVGEVFDMVSRRMVSFQDVEKIFQRITSEGGIFANMQEVQSRTLAGMISNLQDSVDIMLNDIGQESEGALKGAVNLMHELVENWRTVAAIGKGVLIPLTTYLAISKTLVFLNRQYLQMEGRKLAVKKLLEAWTKKEALAQAGLNAAAKANPYILLASVLIGTISGIVSLIRNATEEQRRMNQAINEGAQKAMELSANFERLANIAVADSSSTEEQTAALEELNRTYGELIPSQYRNAKALKEMQGDYSAVTAAIYDKIDAQTREKLVQDALTEAGEDSGKWTDKIIKRLEDYGISADSAMVITREFQERLENGDYSTAREAIVGLRNIIKDFAGEAANAAIPIGALEKPANKLFKIFSSLKDTLDKISDMEFNPFRKGGDTKIYRQLKEGLDNIISTTDDYRKRLQDGGFTFTYSIELDEAAKDLQISKIQTFIKQLQQQIDSGIIDEKDVASVQNIIEDAQKAIENIRISDRIDEIQDLRVEISKLTGIDFGKLNITQMLPTESDAEYIKKIQQEVKSMKEVIDLFDKAAAQGEIIPQMQQDSLIGIGNTIENYTKTYQALLAFLERIAFTPDETKKGGKGTDHEAERIRKIIAMLKEMREQYKKLREEYSEEEATAMIQTSYAQTAKDLELPDDFLTTMTFDVSGIIDGAKKVFKTTSDEGKKLINQFTDGLETEIDLEIRVKNREKIKNELDSLFSDYEMTLEIQKLGGDVSWADLFGIDWTTTGDIQRQAEETISKLTAIGGEKAQEDIKKIQERVHTAIENEQKQWIQKFADILSKSVDEIQSVQQKGLKGISVAKQFFDEEKLSAEQYAAVIKYVVKSVNEETSKIALDKFKNSSDYIQAMGDMAAYSTSELQRLLNRLKEIVAASAGNMDAENLKTYMDAIQNIQDAIDQRKSPFQKNEIAQLQELNRLEAEFTNEQERQRRLQQERLMWSLRVNEAQERLNALKKKEEAGDSSTETALAISMANADLIDATENLQNADNAVTTSQANLSIISGKIGNIIGDVSAAMFKIEKVFTAVINGINGAIEIFGSVSELVESFGADMEKGGWSDAKIFFDSLGEVSQSATQAFQSFMSGDIIGGIASSVSFITDIIKFFNQIHDNQREKIIVAETEKVEKLAEDYADLEKTIDNALDVSDLREYDRELTRNFQQQLRSYDRMIAAEKDKKNPDEDQIEQWEQERKDLVEGFDEDLEAALVQAGGVARDEYLSQTQDFVDAWVEAFQETGDGLSGLEGNFEEFFLNVLKQQAAMAISEKFIQLIIDDLNAALNDYELDDKEAQDLYDKAMSTMPELSKFLEEWFKPFLGIIGNTEEGSLSGLQKGIQGVTEETAQIIEALLNSMRYYVADTNTKLNSIYLMLSGTEGVPNPMLVELRAQTEQLRAINRLIRNVTASGHPNGGDGIKIFMN